MTAALQPSGMVTLVFSDIEDSTRLLAEPGTDAYREALAERTAALDGWLWHYNHRRRHSAIGHQPPIRRTNLLGSYTRARRRCCVRPALLRLSAAVALREISASESPSS